MKKYAILCGFCTALFTLPATAHNIQLNASIAPVTVADEGELTVNGKDVTYHAWQSSALSGKVRILQHIAGRASVKEKNEPLMEAIKTQHFDPAKYQTTTIINADDAIIGTGAFVKSSAERGKKENMRSQVILDQQSAVKNAWDLKEKESLIVVLDHNGKVKFVKEGKLSLEEIQQVIELTKKLIAQIG
ncbi:MAG: YtfJ family protein [[Pasteurella] mairii]|uniref:Transcriptional regulator YtfJ n=1 Tax=[Pasteurella] mairii TaxID=757 RepID=A0A379B4R3_9PAST|nr:YtfJ family protein [[Pasteurella] mairii]SUB33597.1 transcriptional regulator YtfJ [[Pasteurella] mairii]